MSRWLRFLPLLVLVAFVGAVAWRLAAPEDTSIKSRMVGELVPGIDLRPAVADWPGWALRSGNCGPVVINFFASWCAPCIAEARALAELKDRGVPIIGIAVRDRPEDVAAFLARHGNPYEAIGEDPESKVQLAFGASGVPETYIVDPYCTIRHQHIGPIEKSDVPLIQKRWEDLRK